MPNPTKAMVDATTGKVTTAPMADDEVADRQQLQTAAQKAQQARQDDDAARDATLAQIAQKIGVSPDDLKAALRLGPVTKPGKPQ